MAGEGVNREVKLTIVTEGEEAARRKIEGVLKGIDNGSATFPKQGTPGTPSKRTRPSVRMTLPALRQSMRSLPKLNSQIKRATSR